MSLETQAVFQRIWQTRRWASDGVHRCGPGNSLEYTANLRNELPKVIARHEIKMVFDAPCGDLSWMSLVNLGEDVGYLGGDIVPSIVQTVLNTYPDRWVIRFDIAEDAFPVADLWFCRSCLNHLSYSDIVKAFSGLAQSPVKYAMFTSHPGVANCDIKTGEFRCLDLQAHPFGFPPPIDTVEDWISGYPRRQMLLWKVDDIRDRLTGVLR